MKYNITKNINRKTKKKIVLNLNVRVKNNKKKII